MRHAAAALTRALAAALPLAALAQDGAAGAPVSAPPPPLLEGLDLIPVHTTAGRAEGASLSLVQLPEGGWLRVEFGRGAVLEEVEADDAGAIPPALLERILPSAVLAEPRLADLAAVDEVEFDSDGDIDVTGRTAEGLEMELEFDSGGRLTSFAGRPEGARALTPAEVQEILAAGGYADAGWMRIGRREVVVPVVNAAGEEVELRLDATGQVTQERALR